jgi:AcrR family transcriptional regulator
VKKGRPRQFDEDEAIEKAMRVFWKNGYEGTSVSDLTSSMGISRPSLYATFGDKRSLFLRSLDRYRESPASYVNRALAKPTAREVVQSLLHGVIDLVTDPTNPGGCLFVGASLPASEESEAIRHELARRRIDGELDIRKRLQKAAREGDLPTDAEPKALAKLAATLIWGISVQSTNGARRTELLKIAELAMGAFPATRRP